MILAAAACVPAAAACVALLQLFHSLKSHAPGDSEWDDLVAFLQEFCSLAKHLQLQHRQNLWNKMTQLGMFEVRKGSSGLLLPWQAPFFAEGWEGEGQLTHMLGSAGAVV
jgi:hypothetical protein